MVIKLKNGKVHTVNCLNDFEGIVDDEIYKALTILTQDKEKENVKQINGQMEV